MDVVSWFELDFPRTYAQVEDYVFIGPYSLIARLVSGDMVHYDSEERGLRNLPNDPANMTEEEFRHEFGLRLRRLMGRKGVTQIELAERTGITQARISGYIRGKNTPSIFVVNKIAQALNCTIDELTYRF